LALGVLDQGPALNDVCGKETEEEDQKMKKHGRVEEPRPEKQNQSHDRGLQHHPREPTKKSRQLVEAERLPLNTVSRG
jgi:hypothetical protein